MQYQLNCVLISIVVLWLLPHPHSRTEWPGTLLQNERFKEKVAWAVWNGTVSISAHYMKLIYATESNQMFHNSAVILILLIKVVSSPWKFIYKIHALNADTQVECAVLQRKRRGSSKLSFCASLSSDGCALVLWYLGKILMDLAINI